MDGVQKWPKSRECKSCEMSDNVWQPLRSSLWPGCHLPSLCTHSRTGIRWYPVWKSAKQGMKWQRLVRANPLWGRWLWIEEYTCKPVIDQNKTLLQVQLQKSLLNCFPVPFRLEYKWMVCLDWIAPKKDQISKPFWPEPTVAIKSKRLAQLNLHASF